MMGEMERGDKGKGGQGDGETRRRAKQRGEKSVDQFPYKKISMSEK